jgi:NhaP-type Na+/H+ or K+/H+ antiporter
MRFNWRRLITAEYGSTFIWLAAILLVSIKNAWHAGDRLPESMLQRSLLAGLAAVTLAYCVARFAKKSGLLAAR